LSGFLISCDLGSIVISFLSRLSGLLLFIVFTLAILFILKFGLAGIFLCLAG